MMASFRLTLVCLLLLMPYLLAIHVETNNQKNSLMEKLLAKNKVMPSSTVNSVENNHAHPAQNDILVKLLNIPKNELDILAEPVEQLPDYVNQGIVPIN